MPAHRLLGLLALLLICQCAAKRDETLMASEASKPRSLSERLNNRSQQGYYQDSEGNWKVQSNQRSSFENVGRSTLDNREYQGKRFDAEKVEKRPWWGKNDYAKETYEQKSSPLTQKVHSPLSAQRASENASAADLPPSITRKTFATHRQQAASKGSYGEAQRHAGENQSDAIEPEIMDWKEQRSLQIQDTKSLLNK